MHSELAGNSAAPKELLRPAYWLVWGREWPGGTEVAEAAIAVAPGLIPRTGLSYSAFQILGCADVYARQSGLRVVFFSDLTRQLTHAGESWNGLRVDWAAGVREMEEGPFPAVFLAVSERAYLVMCDPVPGNVIDDRRSLRRVITRQLGGCWSGYNQRQIDVSSGWQATAFTTP